MNRHVLNGGLYERSDRLNPIQNMKISSNSCRQIAPACTCKSVHARQCFTICCCKLKRRDCVQIGKWVRTHMEHRVNEPDTSWYINTGQPPTSTGTPPNSYNSCDRAGSSYAGYSPSTFATSDKCIDRPVHHTSGAKHDAVLKVTVNLGDTRQDSVILRGTGEPRGTQGVTVRPRPPGGGPPNTRTSQSGEPESDVTTRTLSLSGCTGRAGYDDTGSGAGVVTGIEIIDVNTAPVVGVGLRPTSLILQAKTTPLLTGGRYHWSCVSAIPGKSDTEQADICNTVSKYHENNATFPRLDVDYTVKFNTPHPCKDQNLHPQLSSSRKVNPLLLNFRLFLKDPTPPKLL